MTSSARRRVASNTAVQLAGKGAVLAIGLVSIAVLTRYLGPDDYGKYTLALMYMQLFGVLADVGIFTTVVREISKHPERTEELVGNALLLRLVLAIGVIALAVGVSLLLPYEHQVRVAILIAGAPLLIGMVNTTFVAVLQSRLRMSRAVVGDVVGRFVSLGLVLLVVGLDLGFYPVLAAAAGGAAATLAVTWRLTRPLVRVRPQRDRAIWRRLLVTAVPLGLALGDQRRLLPRRHADHLALRALQRGRPLHARLPGARAGARGRHGLPQHRPSRSCPRRWRTTSRARGARSRRRARCAWCWALRSLPAGWSWRPRSWTSPAARSSTARPSRCASCSRRARSPGSTACSATR